ncbi:MAG TPA: amino acid adenylation domain-containing protein, partial [Kineosporiaceae bacterium]
MHLAEQDTVTTAGPTPDTALVEQVTETLTGVLPSLAGAPAGATLRDAGLSSLPAVRLALQLQHAFGVELPLARLADCSGAAELAAWIAAQVGARDSARADVRVGRAEPDGDGGEPFPVTPLQQSYLLGMHEDVTDDPMGCHLYREFEVPGLDPRRLRDAWDEVIAAQEMLRTRIATDGTQQVLAQLPVWEMPVHDHRGLDDDDFAATLRTARRRLSHRARAAGSWPLFAVEVSLGPGGRGVVHLGVDALITDGTGMDLLLARWWQAYHEPGTDLPVPAVTVRESLAALSAAAAGPGGRADLDYWTARLGGLPPGPAVLRDPPPPPTGQCRTRTPRTAVLPPDAWTVVRREAARLRVSAGALVLAVLADTLRRHTGPDPFTVLLTTNDRVRLPSSAAGLVGPFTSSSVVVVDAPAEATPDELATAVHAWIWEGLDHGRVGAVEVLRELRRHRPVPPLPVVFTSLLDIDVPDAAGSFAAAVTYAVSQTSHVALDVQVREQDGALHVHWDCADDVLPPGLPPVLFAGFVNGLAALAATAGTPPLRRGMNELQRAYFVARMTQAGPWDGCQVSASFPVRDLDLAALETAWQGMLTEHEALRTLVTRDGDLLVLPAAPHRWHVPVLVGTEGAGPGVAGAGPSDLARRAFPLDRWPQFDLRVTCGEGPDATMPDATVQVTLDLVSCDGRSVHLLLRELFRRYAAATGRPYRTPSVPLPAEVAPGRVPGSGPGAGPGSAPGADDVERARTHWERRLADLPPGPRLPMPGAPGRNPARTRHQGTVPGWRALRDRVRAAGLHPDALLTAALTEVLARRFAEPFAVPLVRWTERTEPCRPGEFTALSWIAHDPEPDVWRRAVTYQRIIDADTAADAVSGLAQLRRAVLRRRRDEAYGYPVVRTGLLDLGDHPLPDGVSLGPWLTCTPDVSMDCIDLDDGGADLRCFWDVVEADFAPGATAELFAGYLDLLRTLAADAPRPAADAVTTTDPAPAQVAPRGELTADEFRRIVHDWNDTAYDHPAPGPVHLLFERQVRLHPEAVAVRSARESLSYRELNRRANELAWRLRDLGVGAGDIVGVSVERGVGMAVAVYGVLKAGAAYLPVDPALPQPRAHDMLADAAAVAVVTTPGSPATWQLPNGVHRLELPPLARAAATDRADRDPGPVAGPDDVAYVIYTSGSTGRPKGVVVTHRPLHNLFQWGERTYGFGPGDTGLCVTSLGFDLSVFDLLGLLGYGAALYVADPAEQKDPELLCEVLRREQITFWNSAPTTLHQMVPFFPAPGTPGCEALRLVFLSGDYTPLSLPPALWAAFPRARLVSLGGATEATVWSNYFPVDHTDPRWRSIPYGRPIDNCRYHVLDEQLRPLPPGREGDLFIGGACLSQGYLNRPELTAERFVRDPFSTDPQARLYRTGDRASYFPDGVICFLGRQDHQVKVRGFRIELGEIEHRLRAHDAVTDAVVLAHPDPTGDRKLVAYLIAGPGAQVTAAEIRAHVASALPGYMVPNHVAFLDRFPATGNGKLDRQALPWPLDGVATAGSHDVVQVPAPHRVPDAGPAPEPDAVPDAAPVGFDAGQVREELTRLFQELLGVAVDPAEDLWDQGATSFTMVQVSMAVRQRYGRRVSVAALLEDPTLEGIATAVATAPAQDAAAPPLAAPPLAAPPLAA